MGDFLPGVPLDSVKQPGQDVGDLQALVPQPPHQLLLLLRDLGERVSQFDILEQGQVFSCCHRSVPSIFLAVSVQIGHDLGEVANLLRAWENDGVGTFLEFNLEIQNSNAFHYLMR